MKGPRGRFVLIVGVGAITAGLAGVGGCAKRPLRSDGADLVPDAADLEPDAAATGGRCGTGGARMELIGSPLLVLDHPPVGGPLYTTLLWTGEEYLFLWRVFNEADGVVLQRIDASGKGVGGNIRVHPYENAIELAWSGGRLGAAWVRQNGDRTDLMFQTFDGFGRPVIDAVLLRSAASIPIDGSVLYGPRIVAIEGGFAIAWTEGQVQVATVDPDGNVLHGPVAAETRLSGTPELSLTAWANRIVVGFIDSQPPQTAAAFAATFSTDLTPVGSVTLDSDPEPGMVQVVATGGGFLAFWAHGDIADIANARVRIAHLDPTGSDAAFGEMEPPVTGSYRYLSPAAWNRDHVVVLWDNGGGETGLKLSRYATNGERQGASIDVPTGAFAGSLYVVAHDGTVGFTWSEEVARASSVYFQLARACP